MHKGWAALALPLFLCALGASAAAPPTSSNPCDYGPLPVCTSALGAITDVTANWAAYQPALSQPIPVADYAADPADNPPFPFGTCGGETSSPQANGQAIPASTAQAPPVADVPAPPGGWQMTSQYCVLRYIQTDFTPLCHGCTRLFIDFDKIPTSTFASDPVSPGADGHWAARVTFNGGFTVAIPQINGHSPNVKNLCSDKYFNKGAGSDCTDVSGLNGIKQFDTYGMGLEGDTGTYHHFPGEGRYYNGPAYLAGDGAAVPLHWVHGIYQDYDLQGASSGYAWYGAGYRGNGDALPDTDLWPPGYACLCEIPPAGHSTLSATVVVQGDAATVTPTPSPSAPAVAAAAPRTLPGTSSAGAPLTFMVSAGLSACLALLLVAGFANMRGVRRLVARLADAARFRRRS